MDGTQTPDEIAQRYLNRLDPLLRPVYQFLEAAAQQSYKHHDDRGAKFVDPWFFSHYVRWELWRSLDSMRGAGDLDFFLARKPMSGLEIAYDGLRLKILRPGDDDESLPDPKNEQQKLFYTENIFRGARAEFFIIKNLAVLWDYDHALRSVSMSLVCPRADGSIFFSVPVPHPATLIEAAPMFEPSDDLDLFERDADTDSEEAHGSEGDDV